ncbi:nuclear GTPase SLIP-GC-like isoform X2 [Paramisgurnus dabryanus]|uniref:nuclear GTPase SLIP-GC-like isoform X2 n=1 Tax=Paramisgurnus dabryanus TaxID=90735 RepID=UPI0031F3C38C
MLYAVITLMEGNTREWMVIASNWLNKLKDQCHWPSFESTKTLMEAVKNRIEPSTAGKPWKMIKSIHHAEYVCFEKAMRKKEGLEETEGHTSTKRKRDHGSSDSNAETLLKTDMEMAKQIMKGITDNLDQDIMMHKDIILKIKQMNEVTKKKATIGIFGKSGEGKSSLLSAILEWEKELQDLFKVLSDDSEDKNEDMIEIAVEKITALYGEDADRKTLKELKNHSISVKIEDFLSGRKKIISTDDVTEFANKVACYILHSEASPGGWYWPLVKCVTFKVPNCRDLLEYIVLVDIPGTGDCNKIRDDLWKSKLKECSFVWIVSAINRVVTDKDPWGILKHCIEELGPGGECKNINFICTKSDDINTVAYIRSARLTQFQSLGDKEQKKECTLHRNELAKTRVKEKFEHSEIQKKMNPDNDFLQVFTVSSSAFFDPDLNLEPNVTEIPKLQEALKNLNKSINRELARDYVNEAKGVLSLIQSVQLDADREMIKDKVHKEYEKNLMKAQKELDKYFDSCYNDLKKCLSAGVSKSIQSCVPDTEALVSPNKDKRGFHKVLQALCNNGGYYWSKNWDVVLDLNKKLADHLHGSINPYFSRIFPICGKTGTSVQEQIDKFSLIQSESSPYPRSPMLCHIQNFIKAEENKLKAVLSRDIVEMKKEIYSSILTTIQNQMASRYILAAEEKGPGSMKRRQEILISSVNSIKNDMFNMSKMEVLKKFNNLKLYIKDALETGLKRSMKLALLQTNNIILLDVSSEIEELERLTEQLSD